MDVVSESSGLFPRQKWASLTTPIGAGIAKTLNIFSACWQKCELCSAVCEGRQGNRVRARLPAKDRDRGNDRLTDRDRLGSMVLLTSCSGPCPERYAMSGSHTSKMVVCRLASLPSPARLGSASRWSAS
eukprot:2597013-Rhodomonas_salina.1